ncbi:MAG: dockerin type I repeat-containing protein [Armatimonadota bacterium]
MRVANHQFAVLVTLAVLASLRAQATSALPTPAGTVLSFYASARYLTASGAALETPPSNTVEMTVLQVADLALSSNLALAVGESGSSARLPFRVTNLGNGPDVLLLSASSHSGWPVRLLDSDQTPVSVTPVLAPGESAFLVALVNLPPAVPEAVRTIVTITAASSLDPSRRAVLELTFAVIPSITPEDLNADEAVTVADISIALGIALGRRPPSAVQLRAGDVAPAGGDGRITIADAIRIARAVLGLDEIQPRGAEESPPPP